MVKRYDKMLTVCYVTLGCCVITIIILLGAMKLLDLKKTDQQMTAYYDELYEEWQDDTYLTYLYVGEASVTVKVNDNFLYLSNQDMLDAAANYVNYATAARTSYNKLNDGAYVPMHFYNESGLEIIKTNSKGQIKIVKDEWQ